MWIALATGAAFGNALWTALSKPVMQRIPPLRMVLLLRVLLSIIFLTPLLVIGGLPTNAGFWLLVAAVGVLQAARWVTIMHGVKHDYFATYAMYNTAPLFTLLFAPATLPERFGPAVWLGVIAVIGGAALFYRTSRVSTYGLVGAVLTAIINIIGKHGVNQVHPLVFLFFMSASPAAVLAVAYWFVRRREPASPRWGRELREVTPMALITAVSGVCFFYALWLDTATRVTAVARTNLIFGFLFSYLLLKEKADWQWKLAGTGLIVAGTVAVAF
jgi:drug/metabolite transporter (DMT)-like permease